MWSAARGLRPSGGSDVGDGRAGLMWWQGRADEDRRSGINTAAAVAGALGTGHGHVNPMWQQLPRRRRPCKFVLRKGSMRCRLHICENDGGWLCCKVCAIHSTIHSTMHILQLGIMIFLLNNYHYVSQKKVCSIYCQ
ncbi:Os05g0521700 [Oryza sativa Japonica Group]|jgi:hypothetical protein|uniref:Os05g0521700 protein n=3 Tax=Oryza sativa subsp. japonica TaxID=39947 RepID=Q0DGN1_ORYSJ|nr:unknown protein [Oryza sativa Japonica Group]KAF2931704.1 hypothetical protein DAI22_05g231400 [Oryza sativa Japonica Group]BAF17992.1 Os05g0521700 [Oryza sativa Japonica Group]BAG91813.1 unnamed protein product [Oryza sativa Japonica Group]|eukprot:NP_001056078.1 Os05g0521700 [Oryza sativa Japonica Group]